MTRLLQSVFVNKNFFELIPAPRGFGIDSLATLPIALESQQLGNLRPKLVNLNVVLEAAALNRDQSK